MLTLPPSVSSTRYACCPADRRGHGGPGAFATGLAAAFAVIVWLNHFRWIVRSPALGAAPGVRAYNPTSTSRHQPDSKHYRASATRYDKLAVRYQATAHIVAINERP